MTKNSLLWRHGAPIKSGISGLCANDKKGRKIITTLSQFNEKMIIILIKKTWCHNQERDKWTARGQRAFLGLGSFLSVFVFFVAYARSSVYLFLSFSSLRAFSCVFVFVSFLGLCSSVCIFVFCIFLAYVHSYVYLYTSVFFSSVLLHLLWYMYICTSLFLLFLTNICFIFCVFHPCFLFVLCL